MSQSPDLLQVDLIISKRYKLTRFISEGSYGQAWRAIDLNHNLREVVLKFANHNSEESIAKLKNEIAIIKDLNHPLLTTYYDSFADAEYSLFYVMDYAYGKKLSDWIENEETGLEKLDWPEIVWIGQQLCEALCYLHNCQVLHLDIRPDNIVYERETSRLRLIDFGQSKCLTNGSKVKLEPNHNLRYLAPELKKVLPSQPRNKTETTEVEVSTAIDIYALGLVLAELLVGELSEDATKFPEQIPASLKTLVRKMLDVQPAARPTTEQVRQQLQALNVTAPTIKRLDLGLVGRADEMNLVKEQLAKTRVGQGSFFVVAGLAGIGKSHFSEAVLNLARTDYNFYTVLAKVETNIAFRDLRPYAPLNRLIKELVNHHPLATPKNSTVQKLSELLPESDIQINYADIFGSEAAFQKELAQTLTQWFGELTVNQPLLLCLEDGHDAEDALLEFLKQLQIELQARPIPVFFNLTLRLEETAQLAKFEQRFGSPNLRLQPLNKAKIQELLCNSFPKLAINNPHILENLVEFLENKSGGRPLFVRELLLSLLSKKVLVQLPNDQGWRIEADALTSLIAAAPLDLEEFGEKQAFRVVEDRIKTLEANDQNLVRLAAMLGFSFERAPLAYLAENLLDALKDSWQDSLSHLLQAEIIESEPGTSRYQFTHAFLHQTAREVGDVDVYQVARLIEKFYGLSLQDQIAETAKVPFSLVTTSKLEQATIAAIVADCYRGDKAFRAPCGYNLIAADAAQQKNAYNEAAYRYETALDLLKEIPNERRAKALVKERPEEEIFLFKESWLNFTRFYLMHNLVQVHVRAGRYEKSREFTKQADRLVQTPNFSVNTDLLAEFYNEEIKLLVLMDFCQDAVNRLKSRVMQRCTGPAAIEARLNSYVALHRKGETKQALRVCLNDLKLIQQQGYKRNEAKAKNFLVIAYRYFHKLRKALEYANQSVSIFEEIGEDATISAFRARSSKGIICRELKMWDEALACFEKNLELIESKKITDLGSQITAYSNLGEYYRLAKAKNFSLAEEYLTKAYNIAVSVGSNKTGETVNAGGLGGLYLVWNRLDKAEYWINLSIEISESMQNKTHLPEMYLCKARLLKKKNDLFGAKELYKKTIDISLEINQPKYQKAAHRELTQLLKSIADRSLTNN